MQAEVARQVLACQNPTNAVPLRIELWRIHAYAELAIDHAKNASTHSALGRQPHLIGPAACVIIQPAGEHHCQHVFQILKIKYPFPGDRVGVAAMIAMSWHVTSIEHWAKYWWRASLTCSSI